MLAADQEWWRSRPPQITNVMEAGRPGMLRRIVAAPGTAAPVGALLAVLADPSVPDSEIDAFIAARGSELQAEAAVQAPRPRLVEANGRRINVLTMGEGDATPLALIHGFGGDVNTWLFNQEALAADRPVHALDMPAHGGSDPDVGAGDLAALAGAVEAALDALGADPVHLPGIRWARRSR
jgi:pyruvate dehydrogenase E2 component (dihydrolipoamide acetyltransferase)